MTLAVVPARSGSQRLPGKNIKPLLGKPLLGWIVEAALKASSIDLVIVSTDSQEIADIAQSFGARVPRLRPKRLATSGAGDKGVALDALEMCEEHCLGNANHVVWLRPTAPSVTPDLIDVCVNTLLDAPNSDGLRTVSSVSGVHHPYWMFRESGDHITPFIEGVDMSQYYQSQLLPKCYRINGMVDIVTRGWLLQGDSMWGGRFTYHEIDRSVVTDIDDLLDFRWAELIMRDRQP